MDRRYKGKERNNEDEVLHVMGFYDDCSQVRNQYAIIAIITYEHACINECGSFFWKTLNCFGACTIIFARAILLNSIHAVEGSDTTVMPQRINCR